MQQQLAQRQTGFLSPRQHLDLLVDVLAGEEERAQKATQLFAHIAHGHLFQRFHDRQVAVEFVGLVLGVVSDVYVVAHSQLSGGA